MKMILNFIRWIVTAFLSLVLLLVVFQKFSNNTMTIGNIYIFQIVSESMLPEYHVGDIIVVKKVSATSLQVGDDVTYLGTSRVVSGLTITHRIVEIKDDPDGTRHFITKGVSNMIEDPEILEENIYGKVIYHTILFSYVGRLMTNVYIYYLLFISVGVSFSYELISSFFIKDKTDDDESEEEEEDDDESEEEDDDESEEDEDEDNSENNSTDLDEYTESNTQEIVDGDINNPSFDSRDNSR